MESIIDRIFLRVLKKSNIISCVLYIPVFMIMFVKFRNILSIKYFIISNIFEFIIIVYTISEIDKIYYQIKNINQIISDKYFLENRILYLLTSNNYNKFTFDILKEELICKDFNELLEYIDYNCLDKDDIPENEKQLYEIYIDYEKLDKNIQKALEHLLLKDIINKGNDNIYTINFIAWYYYKISVKNTN